MYVGLTFSFIAHASLLAWALVNFQATPPLKIPEREAVEVALVTEDDLVRLTKGDRSSKKLKTRFSKQTEKVPVKKIAKKPLVKTVQPPPTSSPPPDDIEKKIASLQPPEPVGPTIEQLAAEAAKTAAEEKAAKAAAELALKKAAEVAKQKAEAEEKKRKKAETEKKRKLADAKRKEAEEKQRKAEKRKKKLAAKRARERKRRLAEKRRRERERAKKFDAGKLSALLNKIPDSKAPNAGSQDPNSDRKLPRGAQAGAPEGRDTRLTASQASLLGSMMKRAVSRCWNINSGLAGIDRIVIDLEVRLGRDGRIRGQPKIANRGGGALFQDAANNAMRAMIQCQPYSLPRELYKGGWDHMVVTFDPQKMF